ncbi:MAG: hypothetical protein HY391_06675 [Deltaproteobacteria bacterium]|nr:hypothetical protein [Deltaproteobacteria bacterium]
MKRYGVSGLCSFLLVSLLTVPQAWAALPHHAFAPQELNFLEEIGRSIGIYEPESVLTVHVIAAGTGEPLPRAAVLVGTREGDPFPGNYQMTSSDGEVTFVDDAIRNGTAVTAVMDGYVAYTITSVQEGTLTIALEPAIAPSERSVTRVEGTITSWPRMADGDDWIHLGIVLPELSLQSFVDLKLNSLVGPMDTGYFYGERKFPSNFFIPKQTEYVFRFIPVEMKKSSYWLPVQSDQTVKLTALQATLPFSDLLNLYRNEGLMSEMMSLVNIERIGTADLYASGEMMQVDVPLSHRLKSRRTVKASGFPKNLNLLMISAVDFSGEGGELVPFDFKMTDKNQKAAELEILSPADLPLASMSKSYLGAFALDLPDHFGEERKRATGMTASFKRDISRNQFGREEFHTFLPIVMPNHLAGTREYGFTPLSAQELQPEFSVATLREPEGQDFWTIVIPYNSDRFVLPELPNGADPLKRSPEKEMELAFSLFRTDRTNTGENGEQEADWSAWLDSIAHHSSNSALVEKP